MVSCSRRWRGGSSSGPSPEIGRLAGMGSWSGNTPDSAGLGGGESVFIAVLAVNFILWSTESCTASPLPVAAVIGCAIFSLPAVELLTWEQDKGRIGWDNLVLIGVQPALGMAIWETGGAAVDRPCLSRRRRVCRLQVL